MVGIEKLEALFFKAAIKRQNGELEEIHDANFPGSNLHMYQEGNLRYVHLQSRGETTGWGTQFIYEGDNLRWYMDSRGACKSKESADFLKLALLEAYQRGEFLAGRGPDGFTAPRFSGFIYFSEVASGSSFIKFSCGEKILKDGKDEGIHMVSGRITF